MEHDTLLAYSISGQKRNLMRSGCVTLKGGE